MAWCHSRPTSRCAMSHAKPAAAKPLRQRTRQAGLAAVEFGIVMFVFLSLLFGVLEITRAMYLFNTLQEVTRHAASLAVNSDFSDPGAMNTVRQNALFRNTSGMLALGDPVSDAHVQIEYLWIPRTGTSLSMEVISPGMMPSNPARNKVNCAADLNSNNCIRLVRVRVCVPNGAGQCDRIPYKLLFPMVELPLTLPAATTIRPAQTLGFTDGMVPGA